MRTMRSRMRYAFVFGLGLLASAATAQSLGRVPAATDQHGTKRPQGFTDYALGKINSDNHDYGSDLQSARGSLTANTVDDAYFWSNCVSLGLLVAVTGCYLLQLRSSDKKEQIAATLIAQMWNGRVSDKIEIDKRTAAYNELVDQHNEVIEKTLSGKPAFRPKRASERINDQANSDAPVAGTQKEIATTDAPAEINSQPVEVTTERKEGQPKEPVVAEQTVETTDRNATQKAALPRIEEIAGDPLALKQEVIRLRSQVGALKNRETNLLVRLNAAEEYKKRRESNSVSR